MGEKIDIKVLSVQLMVETSMSNGPIDALLIDLSMGSEDHANSTSIAEDL
jgi:hypothetical protein